MARYPALDVHAIDPDLVLAIVDDHSPAAVEEHEDGVRVFFGKAEDRDHAGTAVLAAYPAAQVVALEVDDEDWARRSQANLQPVTVGRITIVPAPDAQHPSSNARREARGSQPLSPNAQRPAPGLQRPEPSAQSAIVVVIQPSMGFGTGHHATTRLCLHVLQMIDLTDASVLDVGTGSGILAIVADRLGARSALGIDHDADAIQSARENLALNPEAGHVTLETGDLRESSLPRSDLVVANLTGALLIASAPLLKAAVKDGGTLVVSGLLEDEEAAVRQALDPAIVTWRGAEQGWVALAANLRRTDAV